MGRLCQATNAKGEPCRSTSVGTSGLCAFHEGRSGLGTAENARKAARRSAEVRRGRAERARETRHMSALDWAAKLVEERGRELAESFLNAARNGDWRAERTGLMWRLSP